MEEYITSIKPYLGKQVITLSRIYYVYKGETNFDKGPLELTFTGNMILHLTGKGDGEKLQLGDEPWQDPFAEPLSEDNREFVQKHGKWALFDVSSQHPYSRFLGQPLRSVYFIRNQFGTIAGLEMNFGEQILYFLVDGDEYYVFIENGNSKLKEIGFSVDANFFIGSV